jgi:hypothetical protein
MNVRSGNELPNLVATAGALARRRLLRRLEVVVTDEDLMVVYRGRVARRSAAMR